MFLLQIGIPDEHYKKLEDLARRAGMETVVDLIEKALMLMQDAVECVENNGHVFFRYEDGTIARLCGLAPDAEDDSKPVPPLDIGDANSGNSPKSVSTLIDVIRKLGWEGPALKIIHEAKD